MVFRVSKTKEDAPSPQKNLRGANETPKRPFKNLLKKQKKPSSAPSLSSDPSPSPMQDSSKQSIFDLHEKSSRHTHPAQPLSPNVPSQEKPQVEVATISPKIQRLREIALSPTMHNLAQQIEQYITIESHKGVSTIELQIELEDPHSLFQGTLIQVEHYDTDPHSFNVQLSHPTQSTVEELTIHLPSLREILQSKFENFQICLLPPTYPELSDPKSLRKIGKKDKTEKTETKKPREMKRNPFLN